VGYEGSTRHLYEYAVSCPINAGDPAGLQAVQLPGTGTIYPSSSGSFGLKVTWVEITDPEDQKVLGNTDIGYIIWYTPDDGICQGPCEKITLTQAWTNGWGPNRLGPAFDYKDDPANKNRNYPVFDRPAADLPISMIDRPIRGSFTYYTWKMTVCAICTTTISDRTGRLVVTIEQVLGCINFKWKDPKGDPTLIIGEKECKEPSSHSGIPAANPEYPWHGAL
jgi:hypothetical protein